MALAGVNPEDMGRHIPEGEYTSKVYGYIRDGKHTQVIKILEKELQVRRADRFLSLSLHALPLSPPLC